MNYLYFETDENHGCGDQHDAQAGDHESLASGFLDEDQRHEGHHDVAGSHPQGRSLSHCFVETGRFED